MERYKLVILLISILMQLTSVPAKAADASDCSEANVWSLFQIVPKPQVYMAPRGIDQPKFMQTFSQCWYRLGADGQTYTFGENDFFMGGNVYYWDYKNYGLTRQEAIADLDLIEDHVFLVELLPGGGQGQVIEQPLMKTSYKDLNSEAYGLVVYQLRAFTAKLTPGEYLSIYEASYQGDVWFEATVHLIITPE